MTTTTFQDLGLNAQILQGIEELGFEAPTPIQEKAIPIFLANEFDLVALAQTGTGKTAAFGLPLLQHVQPNVKTPQALILSPTRELCVQIANDLNNLGKHLPNLRITAVYGGANILTQMRELRQGAQIVVATPGRLMDLLERKAVDLSAIKFLILDEADEMLNMGFEEDVRHILSFTPDTKRVGLFSATMPAEIRNIATQYLHEPIEITIGRKNSAQQNIEHCYAMVGLDHKYEALKRILDAHPDFYGIIFCATKTQTQEISDALVRDGYPADCLHGDLGQPQRDKVMNHFRHKAIQILLATDVAARGLDVQGLTHVIHYQLPDDIENYTHRSGRTARAGKKGVSIAMLLPRDKYKLAQLERQLNTQFIYTPIPSAGEVREKKLAHFLHTIASTEIDSSLFDELLESGIAELEKLDKRDLIQKMLSLEFKRFSADYANSPDLNLQPKRDRGAARFESSSSNGGKRMFINLGSKDRMRYDEMREFIFQSTGVSGRAIREIEMKDSFSFFNTDESSAQQIFEAFNGGGISYRQRALRVDFAEGKSNESEGGRRFERRDDKGFGSKPFEHKPRFGGEKTGFKKSFDRKEKGSFGREKKYGQFETADTGGEGGFKKGFKKRY